MFADASFANNADLSSQVGFVVKLMDECNKTNVIHYFRFESKQVTIIVFAAYVFTVVHSFDFSSAVRLKVSEIMGK